MSSVSVRVQNWRQVYHNALRAQFPSRLSSALAQRKKFMSYLPLRTTD